MTTPTESRNPGQRLERVYASARFGRIRARAPRYLFMAFLAIMVLAGLRATIAPSTTSSESSTESTVVDYAEQSFAAAFARSYLTFDALRPGLREHSLAPFVSSGLGLEGGFSPPSSGAQQVEWTEIAQVQRPLAGGVIITVAAQLSTAETPVYLSVPVRRAASGAVYLSGYPAFVGPPLTTTSSFTEASREAVSDEEITTLVSRSLTNYLAGDAENLAADLAEAATVTLPTSTLTLASLDRLEWVSGVDSGAVLATVSATDSRGGEYVLQYEVGVRRVDATDPRIAPGWRITYLQTISQEP